MKKLLLIFSLFIVIECDAQQDTTTVEQYCEVVAKGRLFSKKVTIDIDYGEERSFWKDNRIRDENGKPRKFNTIIDAMNYLGRNRWRLVNAFPDSAGNEPITYHYVFKKDFPKNETGE